MRGVRGYDCIVPHKITSPCLPAEAASRRWEGEGKWFIRYLCFPHQRSYGLIERVMAVFDITSRVHFHIAENLYWEEREENRCNKFPLLQERAFGK